MLAPPNIVCQFWYFCVKVHKNALFHTKSPPQLYSCWGEVHLLSRPYPLGTYGTSTWHLRLLVLAPRWLKHTPKVKILATSLVISANQHVAAWNVVNGSNEKRVRTADLVDAGEGFWRPLMSASHMLFTMSLPVDVITLTSSELHQHRISFSDSQWADCFCYMSSIQTNKYIHADRQRDKSGRQIHWNSLSTS